MHQRVRMKRRFSGSEGVVIGCGHGYLTIKLDVASASSIGGDVVSVCQMRAAEVYLVNEEGPAYEEEEEEEEEEEGERYN